MAAASQLISRAQAREPAAKRSRRVGSKSMLAAFAAAPPGSFGVTRNPFPPSLTASSEPLARVACDAEEQVRRAMKRDNIPESEARQRLAAQLPIVDKVRRGDYVVWTTGTHEETDRQVDDIIRTLNALNGQT